jgi:isopenicillin-N epimerase
VTSHGANSTRTDRTRFRLEFDWTGTSDPTAYLSVPAAIRFVDEVLPGGWDEARARCHRLAIEARTLLCEALETDAPAPDDMIGAMASVPFPPSEEPFGVQGVDLYNDPVHAALLRDHGMQVVINPWPTRPAGGPWRRLIRVSAALYNDRSQFERLAEALPEVVERVARADRPVRARS